MTDFSLRLDDLSGAETTALLKLHLDEMHQWSPACKINSLPVERLKQPDVTFYSAWSDGALAACGAIKHLDDHRGELKAMRAAPEFRGRGAGEAILIHLLDVARDRGYDWVGLETGATQPFQPAHRLYQKHGFAVCPAFDDYVSDEFSLCMGLSLR